MNEIHQVRLGYFVAEVSPILTKLRQERVLYTPLHSKVIKLNEYCTKSLKHRVQNVDFGYPRVHFTEGTFVRIRDVPSSRSNFVKLVDAGCARNFVNVLFQPFFKSTLDSLAFSIFNSTYLENLSNTLTDVFRSDGTQCHIYNSPFLNPLHNYVIYLFL